MKPKNMFIRRYSSQQENRHYRDDIIIIKDIVITKTNGNMHTVKVTDKNIVKEMTAVIIIARKTEMILAQEMTEIFEEEVLLVREV